MINMRPIALALGLALSLNVGATTLNGSLTADNEFLAYISTSDAVLGTQISSGNNWQATYTFSGVSLTGGGDYYLHIVARDWGRPEALIGQFTLSDSNYHFANGTQVQFTNTSDWRASDGTWGNWTAPTTSPEDRGLNGVAPWGTRTGISSDAHWIWSKNYGSGTSYFSTTITAAVPEPETFGMLLAGLGLLGVVARRKRAA